MEPARAASRRLVVRGDVEITQGGAVVAPSTAMGPIAYGGCGGAEQRPAQPRRARASRRADTTPAVIVVASTARGIGRQHPPTLIWAPLRVRRE